MRLRPMPVIMVSSLTERGSEVTLRALELGAVDFVTKPKLGIRDGMLDYSRLIADKIRSAARAQVKRAVAPSAEHKPAPALRVPLHSSEKLVIVGASTGGTEAIRALLQPLPANSPGILITQHMPAGFTRSFAKRLDTLCAVTVTEAEHGERVLPGHVYLAPGGERHMKLARSGANYVIELVEGPPVNRHRPSVDVLFDSAATVAGRNAVGVLLTGMGRDGAAGMLKMRQAGASTLAQDEASCIVYGMPREAVALGAVEEIASLSVMTERILARLGDHSHRV